MLDLEPRVLPQSGVRRYSTSRAEKELALSIGARVWIFSRRIKQQAQYSSPSINEGEGDG